MSIRLILLPVFLICAVHAARALGMESIFLDAVRKLPVELSLVKNCGAWEEGGRGGTYRMVVADVYNGAGNELYVQWIGVKDSKSEVITTAPISELNNDHGQYAFRTASCKMRGKSSVITIEADYEHDENGQVHDISVELGDVGTYRLIDKIRSQ
jgi:hypothetical protein